MSEVDLQQNLVPYNLMYNIKCTHLHRLTTSQMYPLCHITDKITNLFYFTRSNWMCILKYSVLVLEKIILLFFFSTSEVISFCLLPTSVWILTLLLPFWNLSWEKLIKWKNVVVGRHESFRKYKQLMLFVFHFPFRTRLRTSLCLGSTLLYLCFCRLLISSFSFMFSKDLSLYFIAWVHSAFL